MTTNGSPRLTFYTLHNLDRLQQLQKLPAEHRRAMETVAHVLPFRVNNYVVDELIDWNDVPADPIFQLTFPQPRMLNPEHFQRMSQALAHGEKSPQAKDAIEEIRLALNPHPEGQLQYNVPKLDDEPVPGVQHKYGETALVFPSAGQTCHAYCSFCFRWAQFVGMPDLKLATDESMRFCEYLRRRQEITDVLFTGGDPLVMRADVLARYIEPLLGPGYEHIQTIRIGTKSLSYWPYRFLSDNDTPALLALLEKVIASGKHLAFMAHFNHWKELTTEAVEKAIWKLRTMGVVIRCQSPLVRHINDDADVWARMWEKQVHLGCVPYYMFVERDTGAKHYFKVPLYRALEIYREAMSQVSGLARTARGPVMSALPGKVAVDGVASVAGQQVFVLSFLQGRDPSWCKRPFFAQFDPTASWLNELRPAAGDSEFFYEPALRQLLAQRAGQANGHKLPVLEDRKDVLLATAT
jgi:KamA family protein